MVFRLHDIASRDPASQLLNVVVDTPKGSASKYRYDEELGLFRLAHILPAGMHFPCDFGSVPRTRAQDGDALDVVVLLDAATFAGCLLTARLLGVLCAEQKEDGRSFRNDRLVAVAETEVNPRAERELRDLDRSLLDEIEQFLVFYNRAHGKTLRITSRRGSAAADAILKRAMREFEKQAARPAVK